MTHQPGTSATLLPATLPPPVPSKRFSSRSNSLSSSSVITVKRSSSQGGHSRDSVVHIRSHSPADSALLAARALKAGAAQPKTTSAIGNQERLGAEASTNEGAGNLNRWSHSTNSSVASSGHPRKARRPSNNANSQTMSTDYVRAQRRPSASPVTSPRQLPDSPVASPTSYRALSAGSPEYQRQRIPTSGSPRAQKVYPQLTLPTSTYSPSEGNTRPSKAQPMSPLSTGLLTPASYSSNMDYFSSDATRSPHARSVDASPSSPNAGHSRFSSRRLPSQQQQQRDQRRIETSADGPRSPEDIAELTRRRSRARERREKDKKTMLSKALEKANTAVLLDNVQNYEGALDAYKDACHLLQLVMDRTNAIEDKRKLEAIQETYTCLLYTSPSPRD